MNNTPPCLYSYRPRLGPQGVFASCLSSVLSTPTFNFSQWELHKDHTSASLEVNSTFEMVSAIQGPNTQGLGFQEGFGRVRQAQHNRLMHAMNGNTTLRFYNQGPLTYSFLQLSLDILVPPNNYGIPTDSQFTRESLLQMRPHIKSQEKKRPSTVIKLLPLLQTTPQFHSAEQTAKAKKSNRTGRRVRFCDPQGTYHNYKPRKRMQSHNSGIQNLHTSAGQVTSTASMRHAGSSVRANEECTPHWEGVQNAP